MSLLDDFAKAIERDDSTQIESLLASGSIDVNARLPRPSDPPPLVFAAECHRTAIVERLLSAGARIDDVDVSGRTACHVAGEARSVDMMSVLLQHPHQPNLEIKDKLRRTPLQVSLDFRVDKISLMLLNAGASVNDVLEHDLCWLASTSTAAIQALLNRGVVVSQLRSLDGSTPLHAVAIHSDVPLLDVLSQYRCAIILLAAGADVNAKSRDDEGQTAFERRRLIARADPRWVLPAFMAAGADLSALEPHVTADVTVDQVETARRDIAKERLDFVRHRALQVCIGLQSLRIDALQMCEILQFACGPVARVIAFHQWWKIATTVKHFRD